jgi:hypothetical protein
METKSVKKLELNKEILRNLTMSESEEESFFPTKWSPCTVCSGIHARLSPDTDKNQIGISD